MTNQNYAATNFVNCLRCIRHPLCLAVELAGGFRRGHAGLSHGSNPRPAQGRDSSRRADGVSCRPRGRRQANVWRDGWFASHHLAGRRNSAVTRCQVSAARTGEFAEPDYLVQVDTTLPNDPEFLDGTLWGLNNYGQNGARPTRTLMRRRRGTC